MKKTFLVVSILILAACKPVQLVTPTQADVDRMSDKFPDLTLEDLNMGKSTFQEDCHYCHRLKDPESKSEKRWNRIVPKMVKRVNWIKKEDGIDSTSQEILRKYLITMSKRAGKK